MSSLKSEVSPGIANHVSDKERAAFDLSGGESKIFSDPTATRHDIVLNSGSANVVVNGVSKGEVGPEAVFNFYYAGTFSLEATPAAEGFIKSSKG